VIKLMLKEMKDRYILENFKRIKQHIDALETASETTTTAESTTHDVMVNNNFEILLNDNFEFITEG